MYIPLQRITGPFCHRFVSFANLGFSHNTILEIEVNLWKKKRKQIFSKTLFVSKLAWEKRVQINNAHLDRSDKKLGQDTNIQRFFKGI